MWFALLLASLLAAGIHLNSRPARPRAAAAELFLIYLLAGYCGFAQILRSIAVLVRGQPLMGHVQFTPGDPAVMWLGFFGLGCGLIGALTIWKRGSFLLAPVLVWTIFWTGTTVAHFRLDHWNDIAESWPVMLWTFATHGLIAVLLAVFYVMSIRPVEASPPGYSAQRTQFLAKRSKIVMTTLSFLGIFLVSAMVVYVLFTRKQPFVDHHATAMQLGSYPPAIS